ncbi:MAG: carbohydrate ABC transporter permease [Atribacterota bacterium]|nr:carbohydrate ABC transporter permease [Atribacterota bacterium]
MNNKNSNFRRKYTSISENITRSFIYIVLIAFVISIVYPLFWIFINSFRSNQELFIDTWGLPKKWLWSNYILAWKYGVGRYFINSVFVTTISTLLTILISSLAAFPLSRFRFKGRYIILMIIIAGMMVTPQVNLISLYKLLQRLGICNTYLALIIPYVAYQIPFTVFLLWSYFISLPKEIDEAAYIDGCSDWQLLWRIILPMSKPIITTSALLAIRVFWNEFMFALVFVDQDELKTIPVGLMNFKTIFDTDWTVLLSALVISTLPMIIAFLVLQKFFIRGLTIGGTKG